jgi:hypothetical protein
MEVMRVDASGSDRRNAWEQRKWSGLVKAPVKEKIPLKTVIGNDNAADATSRFHRVRD